jgi:hypothetical protein
VGWTPVTVYRCAHYPANRWTSGITLNVAGFLFSQAHRQDMKDDPSSSQAAFCLERPRVVAKKCLDAPFNPP